jgi:hypothetical protein
MIDGMEISIRIPRERIETSSRKLIDVDETTFSGLSLK